MDLAGTASTSRFPANTVGFLTSPAAKSWSGSFVFAEANTSGLTPWRIWAASSSEPAKEKRTRPPSNCRPYCVKAFWSDAAADTTSRPELLEGLVELLSSLPHPAGASARYRNSRPHPQQASHVGASYQTIE